MSAKTYKIMIFLKRRPGMSVEDFRDYYENVHAKLALKYSRGVKRYVRRYIDPLPNPETGADGELEYDVITELWFDDEATFRGTVKYMSTNLMPEDIIADEMNLFDRSKIRNAVVVECETDPSELG